MVPSMYIDANPGILNDEDALENRVGKSGVEEYDYFCILSGVCVCVSVCLCVCVCV